MINVGRVACDYKNKNLAVRVEEISKKPDYLAIKFLYQGGQTEIVGADIATVINLFDSGKFGTKNKIIIC